MIENERNPSWVPLVTLFLPVAQTFRFFRQSVAASFEAAISMRLHFVNEGCHQGKTLFKGLKMPVQTYKSSDSRLYASAQAQPVCRRYKSSYSRHSRG